MVSLKVGIIPFGEWDLRKVVENRHKDDVIRFGDQLFEFTMKLVERKSTEDKIITQFVMIMDLEKFSFRQIASRESKENMKEEKFVIFMIFIVLFGCRTFELTFYR